MRWYTTPEFDEVYEGLKGPRLSFANAMIKDLFKQHDEAWARAGRVEAGFWIAKRRTGELDVAIYWDYENEQGTALHTVLLIVRD